MLIEDAHIYPYIIDYLDEIPVLDVKKGKYFSRAFSRDTQIFYILKGTVKVESVSDIGKKVLVDVISENEFAGQLSYLRQNNLYCNSYATTEVKLLCLKADLMQKLLDNNDFSNVFYFKISTRLYQMYKKMLMNNLFNQCEIVSYYVLNQSVDNKFIYKSIYDICETLNISRRNLYNILNKFEDKNIIKKIDNGVFLINDDHYLIDRADGVTRFLENKY